MGKIPLRYSLYRYYDKEQQRPEYIRLIDRFSCYPLSDYTIDDNQEIRTSYNADSKQSWMICYDFKTKQWKRICYFYDISYQEAIKQLSRTDEERDVVCAATTMAGDTLITDESVNGASLGITKLLVAGTRKEEYKLDGSGTLDYVTINYEEDDMHIEVRRVPSLQQTDSIYTEKGKEVRAVSINEQIRMETMLIYDLIGNLRGKVTKTKYKEKMSDEEFNKILENIAVPLNHN